MANYKREEAILLSPIHKIVLDQLDKGAIIAGGAITSVFSAATINDYDIFFLTKQQLDDAIKAVEKEKKDETKTVVTDCAYSFVLDGIRYQYIKVLFGDVKKVLDSFDFTICQGAYNRKDGFTLGTDFLRHLSQRKLVFLINAGYPICSLYRARKFIKRGFHMSGIESVKLGLRIQALKLDTYKELREQLMGIDTLFLKELTDSLKGQAEKTYNLNEFLEMLEQHLTKLDVLIGEGD